MQLIVHPVGGENFLIDVPAGYLIETLRANVAGKLGVAPELLSLQFGGFWGNVVVAVGRCLNGGPPDAPVSRAALCATTHRALTVAPHTCPPPVQRTPSSS